MHVNLSLRQQPFIVLISWPSTWLHSIFSDSLQLWYRCLTEQKGRIEKIRNHRSVMHDFPQSLCAPSPITSLATYAASSSFSRVTVIYSPAIATISSSLGLFFSCFQLLSCYLCVPLSIFCCVFSSSVPVRVLSSAISCFCATLIAPRLLVVATWLRFRCVFMSQLKRSKFKMF